MSSSRRLLRSLSALIPATALLLAMTGCASGTNLDVAAKDSRPSEQSLTPAVQAQVDYVLTYWSDYNPEYGVLGDDDCVNFTSQSLLERGWVQDDEWFYGGESVWDSSPAWVSSTAFNEYLAGRPDLVAPLEDSQRDQVAVGDIVQFDWDNSGDRDHTGVVTKIAGSGDDIVVSFAGHTDDSDYRSVDAAITEDHPGGTAYYWHILAD